MQVKIMQRQVFYKYAEVEINLDEKKLKEYIDVGATLTDYLFDNEDLFCDELARELSESEYEFGFGMHEGNFTDHTEESEWRYELENGNGGHL